MSVVDIWFVEVGGSVSKSRYVVNIIVYGNLFLVGF